MAQQKNKTVHAVTARGAKIIRRHKNNTWYLKRGDSKIALTVQEAACVALDGEVFAGLDGGWDFERMVADLEGRSIPTGKVLVSQ